MFETRHGYVLVTIHNVPYWFPIAYAIAAVAIAVAILAIAITAIYAAWRGNQLRRQDR